MENIKELLWVVYIKDNAYEGSTSIIGVVYDLEKFKKLAKEEYGIMGEPEEDYYGRGSLHYEYSIKKSEKYSEYYDLIAEPITQIL